MAGWLHTVMYAGSLLLFDFLNTPTASLRCSGIFIFVHPEFRPKVPLYGGVARSDGVVIGGGGYRQK